MKVFDFTNGVKGEQVGVIPRANSTGGWLVEKNGQTYRVELNGDYGASNQKWTWHTDATYLENGSEIQINPTDFGVEAVCFCFGEFAVDRDNYEWWWSVVGTTEWNRNACKAGYLKATKVTA
jgi:hypothetical protein